MPLSFLLPPFPELLLEERDVGDAVLGRCLFLPALCTSMIDVCENATNLC